MEVRPRISVLMAAYNCESYVAEAVRSVLAQSLSDFEFIIVDDGSTDGTTKILQEFAELDPRIQLLRQSNRGLTKSLNSGLAQCRGEFVARMDADDICRPERFRLQLDFLESNPACVAVGGAVVRCFPDDRPGELVPVSSEHCVIEQRLLHGEGIAICHPTLFARLKVINALGGYREQFQTAQDLDLYLRLAEVGLLSNVDDVVLEYRRHETAVGSSRPIRQYRDVRRILKDAYRRRGRAFSRDVVRHWRAGAASNHFQATARGLDSRAPKETLREAAKGLFCFGERRFLRLAAASVKRMIVARVPQKG